MTRYFSGENIILYGVFWLLTTMIIIPVIFQIEMSFELLEISFGGAIFMWCLGAFKKYKEEGKVKGMV